MKYFSKINFLIILLVVTASLLYGNTRLIASVLYSIVLIGSLVGFRKHCHLKERMSIVTVGLVGYTILYISSCLFGSYGSESLPNAASLLIGATLYIFLLAFSGEKMIDRLPLIFSGGCSVIALLSLDASSTQFLTRHILIPILENIGGPDISQMQYEEGMRIIGIVGGANVLAGLLAIATLISLYMFIHTSESYNHLSGIILMINASVFFLTFSMGAFAAFVLGLVVYFLFSSLTERNRVFIGIILTAVTAFICAWMMTIGLGRYGSVFSFLTILFPFIFGEILVFIFPRILISLKKMRDENSHNIIAVISVGLASIVVLYIVLAFTISTPIKLNPWGVERVAYLSPGDYSIQLKSDDQVKLLIASQSRLELLDGEYTYLYNGIDSHASFTVPKESGIVRFNFTGRGELYRATYEGTQEGKLSMNSPLIPDFVANRMRGIFFSKNVLERFEMSHDGLKLFASSPVLGCGAGAFEAKAYSVQQHYYETKYVHNQYVQSMVDMGIIGLALFILILSSAFYKVIRKREENPPLAAVLIACLVVATVHGVTEVVWSMHAYLIFLLVLMAICDLSFSTTLKKYRLRIWIPRIFVFAVLGFSLALIMHLLILNNYRSSSEAGITQERIAKFIKYEPFVKEIYQLDYVCNYGANAPMSSEYLDKLRSRKSYDVNILLLQYIYLPSGDEENIKTASKEAYRDRQFDKDAVEVLYNLLLAYDADKLLLKKGE